MKCPRLIKRAGEKIGISSLQALAYFFVVVILGEFVWWLITQMFDITWIRDIGFLIILVVVIFVVAWFYPKLVLAQTGRTAAIKQSRVPKSRLEHNGVIWEDGGFSGYGGLRVVGPLCPKDYTPLCLIDGGKIKMLRYNETISDSYHHSQLYCPECKNEYDLGTVKTTEESKNEVSRRFEGKRNREQTS